LRYPDGNVDWREVLLGKLSAYKIVCKARRPNDHSHGRREVKMWKFWAQGKNTVLRSWCIR
jgi:hypothetical protein